MSTKAMCKNDLRCEKTGLFLSLCLWVPGVKGS